MFPRSAGQGGVPGRQKNEMFQIGAGQTEGAFLLGQGNPGVAAERLATLVAS